MPDTCESALTAVCESWNVKPGLHVSRKDRKDMVANTFFLSFSCMPWSSQSCNDRKYSYFTRNTCNRCINSLKILFGATSEACSATVTTIWRPGLSEKYSWDNAGDLKQLSMDQTLSEDNRSD